MNAQEAGGKINRTKNHATKETEEQKNNFVVVEFPNANSKVEDPSWSNPRREAITSVRITPISSVLRRKNWTSKSRLPHQHLRILNLVDPPTNQGEA